MSNLFKKRLSNLLKGTELLSGKAKISTQATDLTAELIITVVGKGRSPGPFRPLTSV